MGGWVLKQGNQRKESFLGKLRHQVNESSAPNFFVCRAWAEIGDGVGLSPHSYPSPSRHPHLHRPTPVCLRSAQQVELKTSYDAKPLSFQGRLYAGVIVYCGLVVAVRIFHPKHIKYINEVLSHSFFFELSCLFPPQHIADVKPPQTALGSVNALHISCQRETMPWQGHLLMPNQKLVQQFGGKLMFGAFVIEPFEFYLRPCAPSVP